MNKKLSIIIPVYNTEKYIERCLTSVLGQTYQNIELICVDDGSTDRSGIILDQLARTDERMTVIHKKNEGVTEARNIALEYVSGEYVGFVDSDDYLELTMYEELVHAMEESDADIVTCGYYMAYDSYIKRAENYKPVPTGIQKIADFLIYIYERDVYKGVAGYLWTRLFKRGLLKDDDGKLLISFRKEFLGADDVAFIADVNMRCRTITYVDKPLYYYYQREGSIVHDKKEQLNALFWIRAYEYVIEQYRGADEKVLDLIKRIYVFRCGKLLEFALQINEEKSIDALREKIKRYLDVYVKTNLNAMERVKWIVDMMIQVES